MPAENLYFHSYNFSEDNVEFNHYITFSGNSKTKIDYITFGFSKENELKVTTIRFYDGENVAIARGEELEKCKKLFFLLNDKEKLKMILRGVTYPFIML